MKRKVLNLSGKFGDLVVNELASSLGYSQEIYAEELLASREAAFSARDAHTFAWHYLKSECFSKWSGAVDDLTALRAMNQFTLTEGWVGYCNERLVDPWSRPWLDTGLLIRARHIVCKILGKFPMEQFPRACEWSSGASTQFKRRHSQVENKWASSAHITKGALPYFEAFVKWAGREELRREAIIQDGNRVTTVPKSWKIDRVIAVEPDWNMFLQKGVGALIRRRLQRFGILKPDAQNIARGLARRGSVDGSLATLDLSAASDCVSLALVEALVPEDWFRVLTDLRSPHPAGSPDLSYNKISSMGNGFTFELETLLFYALACSLGNLGSPDIHVYGDDIICPSSTAPELGVLLLEAGFFLNEDKSFASGPFRESCGGHYYTGVDVTPFYCKRQPKHVAELCVLGNHITKWCGDRGWLMYHEFTSLAAMIKRAVPRRYWGPYGYDGVLWQDWDSARPSWSTEFQAWRGSRFVPVYEHDGEELAPEGALLQAMWRGSADFKQSTLYRPVPRTYRSAKYTICKTQWNVPPVR